MSIKNVQGWLKRIVDTQGKQPLVAIARHIGTSTITLWIYAEGQDVLTDEQKSKLIDLVNDYNTGNTPRGGFYEEDNQLKWSSKR
jgi:hypothetical protein